MASTTNPTSASTAYKDERQQLHVDENASAVLHERQDPRLTFATAAFAFRNALDTSRRKKSTQPTVSEQEVKEVLEDTDTVDPLLEEEKRHLSRHKDRIRIARTIQHLLSSVLSLIILGLQAKICSENMNSAPKGKEQSEILKELLPVLMLLATAIAAMFFDICALTVYFWPQTKFGKKAFAVSATCLVLFRVA